jgi:hypothetical protein
MEDGQNTDIQAVGLFRRPWINDVNQDEAIRRATEDVNRRGSAITQDPPRVIFKKRWLLPGRNMPTDGRAIPRMKEGDFESRAAWQSLSVVLLCHPWA